MGYGEVAAFQVEQMALRARAGLTSEHDARREAAQFLNNLSEDDRREALEILARKAQEARRG